jgi:putative photosynthetic complex assembly protein
MSDPVAGRSFPRAPLIAAALLVTMSIAAVGAARYAQLDTSQVRPSPALASRDLRFEDRPDGSVAVRDARSGAQIGTLAPGADNFVRGTLRSLARARRMHSVTQDPPFQLTAHADGRLTLHDPATGTVLELAAFGITNAGAFARFLDGGAPHAGRS